MKCRTCNTDLRPALCPDNRPGCMVQHLWCPKCNDRVNRYLGVLSEIRDAEAGRGPALTPRECSLLHERRRELWASLTSYERDYVHAPERGRDLDTAYANVVKLTDERDAAIARAEERESDMHNRIRAGYDKTVADAWRAEVARVTARAESAERERDEAVATFNDASRLRSEIQQARITAENERDELKTLHASAIKMSNGYAEQWWEARGERDALAARIEAVTAVLTAVESHANESEFDGLVAVTRIRAALQPGHAVPLAGLEHPPIESRNTWDASRCTPYNKAWCHLHGDCTCGMNTAEPCPLHGLNSECAAGRDNEIERLTRELAASQEALAKYMRDGLASVKRMRAERDAHAAQLRSRWDGLTAEGYAAELVSLRKERDDFSARIDRVRKALPHLNDVVSEFPCDGKDHEMKVFDSLASVRDAIRDAAGDPPHPPVVEPSERGLAIDANPIWDEARAAVNAALPGDRYDWTWVAEGSRCAVMMVKHRDRHPKAILRSEIASALADARPGRAYEAPKLEELGTIEEVMARDPVLGQQFAAMMPRCSVHGDGHVFEEARGWVCACGSTHVVTGRSPTDVDLYKEGSDRSGPLGETIALISEELKRGRAKFPGRRFLLAALTEEVGEVARAYLQRQPRSKVVAEAVQVAGLAIRIIEEGDSTFDDITDAESKL